MNNEVEDIETADADSKTEPTTDPKYLALMSHFGVKEEEINDEGHNTYTVDSEPGEYMVLTDDEAENAWDDSLDQYLEDCVLDGLPDIARNYFDSAKWKRDAKHDGRGHSLSSYDGDEIEVKIDDMWIFIYRTN